MQLSLKRERIRGLFAELNLLFEDIAFPDSPLPFALSEGEQDVLTVGKSASIHLDAESGMYILADDSPSFSGFLMTASQDRLIDFVFAYLARDTNSSALDCHHTLISKCVGQTVMEVERSLILATLRHCRGNRARGAKMLGISLSSLRSKLRSYWRSALDHNTPATSSDRGQKPKSVSSPIARGRGAASVQV